MGCETDDRRRWARKARREVERAERNVHAAAVRLTAMLDKQPNLGRQLADAVRGGNRHRPASEAIPNFWKEKHVC